MTDEIRGYRPLSEVEISHINAIKEVADRVGQMVEMLAVRGDVDTRWVSIGRTHLQQGFMALTRAVAQPTSF